MDTSIVVAIIGCVSAVLGPIITFVATKAYENRFLQSIARDRRESLSGRWKGVARQRFSATGVDFEAQVMLTIRVAKKVVTGDARYSAEVEDEQHEWSFRFSGGFLHDRFLRLDYASADAGVIQFGSMVLQLSADGMRLSGLYQGYGVKTEGLVHGALELAQLPN